MFKYLATISQRLSPGLRKIMNNTSWLVADRMSRIFMGLLVGVWVARYLGPQQFGILNYGITFVALFSPLAKLGLDSLVVRDLARNPLDKNKILGTTFLLKSLGGLLTLSLVITFIYLFQPQDNSQTTIWVIGIIGIGTLFQSFDTIEFWFRSQIQAKYSAIAKNIAYFLAAFIRIFLIQIQASLILFAGAILGELFLSGIALIIIYTSQGNKLWNWRFDWNLGKKLLKESFPLILSGFTIYIYSKIDQVMLGSLLPDANQLGFYVVAVKLSELFDFLPVTINTSLLPKLSEIKERSEQEYRAKFQVYFDLMTLLWLGIAIPISLLSPVIVNLLYGSQFKESAVILSIYIWAQFGTNFGVARSTFLIINRQSSLKLYLTLIGAILNIALNYYLIPLYGAIGATIATLSTYFVTNILLNFCFAELRIISRFILRSTNLYFASKRIYNLFYSSH